MGLPLATLHGAAGIACSQRWFQRLRDQLRVHLDRIPRRPRQFLFMLGLAVVFAMLASYGLSRTLTPITIDLLLKGERHATPGAKAPGVFAQIHRTFDAGFERCVIATPSCSTT